MSTYYYSFQYDHEKDQFDAEVESVSGELVFSINNIGEIRDLIKTNVMSHIDDTIGLELYLKHNAVIDDIDKVVLLNV